jgi:chromate reductase
VRALRDMARSCDALLISCPEYNHSFSPVLGNALAWLSRDGSDGAVPIARKPYAAISAAGYSGGMRAQGHLRDTMHYFRCPALLDPEFLLNLHDKRSPAGRFDAATGDVLDAALQAKLAAVVQALAALTRKLGSDAAGAGLAPTALA